MELKEEEGGEDQGGHGAVSARSPCRTGGCVGMYTGQP